MSKTDLHELLRGALDAPPECRAAFLDAACAGDAELRAQLERLLRLTECGDGFLDRSPITQPSASPSSDQPDAGRVVGAYRLLEPIGHGGMSEVWLAERVEGGFHQQVAIKLIHGPLGAAKRFRAEREILAGLAHPGIARLYDGGVEPGGGAWMSMEYVEGEHLAAYCRAHALPLAERLALFLQVCDAVAYAHTHLVVHRDLKPANVLVTRDGQAKLLDFGIARLLDEDAREATRTIRMTPAYAAPEQLSGGRVGTASDVHALGVILFELLTDRLPWTDDSASLASAVQRLLDAPLPLPSRVAGIDAPVARRALRGDLDAIVAKALRREPDQRYPDARALADDVRRHLAHEPVQARAGARSYVLRRFLRRHWLALSAAAAVFVAMAAAIVVVTQQVRKARLEAQRAAAVQAFMVDLFRTNSSNQPDPVKARATTARELLDVGAKRIEGSLDDAPENKLALLRLFGDLYNELALKKDEVRLRRQAVELTRGLYGADSPELVAALSDLAGAMLGTEAASESEPLLREALAILDRNGDRDSEVRGRLLHRFAEQYENVDQAKALDYAQQSVRVLAAHPPSADLAEAWYTQGVTETYFNQNEKAVTSLNRAIEISGAAQGVPNPNLVFMYYQLAQTQLNLGDFSAAERSARQALQMALAVNGEDHVDAVRTRTMLGNVLLGAGRLREGLDLLAQAKRSVRKLFPEGDPFHTPYVLQRSGFAQSNVGDVTEGLADLEAAVAIRRRAEGDSLTVASIQAEEIADDLIDLGRYDEARRTLDEADAICAVEQCALGKQSYSVRVMNAIAGARVRLALAEGRIGTAREALGGLIVGADPESASHQRIVKWLLEAEIALRSANAAEEVEPPLAKVRAEIERGAPATNRKLYLSKIDMIEGESRLKRHDANAALVPLQRALAAREEMLVAPNPRLAEAQTLLATCYLELGRTQEARDLASAAAAIDAHYAQLGARYRRPLKELRARLGRL